MSKSTKIALTTFGDYNDICTYRTSECPAWRC